MLNSVICEFCMAYTIKIKKIESISTIILSQQTTMSRAEYQELWDYVMSNEKTQNAYKFRIDMIDGVKVNVWALKDLDHKKQPYMKFEIDFWHDIDKELCRSICHNFDEFILLMTTRLPQLRFDKHSEQFTKPEKRFESLIRMHNVKPDGEMCCVCHELTISKTQCKHHMCLQCWSQLANTSCPMCRKCLCCNADDCEND